MYRGKTPYVLSVVVTDGVYDGNRPVDRHSKPLEKRTAISTEEEQLETGTQKIPVSIRVFEKYIKDTKPMCM